MLAEGGLIVERVSPEEALQHFNERTCPEYHESIRVDSVTFAVFCRRCHPSGTDD